MSFPAQSVLFVTDELFLPVHNGSCRIYLDTARQFAENGCKVHCISFYRDPHLAACSEVKNQYAREFASYIFLPAWNGGGSFIGKAGNLVREVVRNFTGNVFATNPFLQYCGRPARIKLAELLSSTQFDLVYLHKIHSALLLGQAFETLCCIPTILDLHDDFVEKERQYRCAYRTLLRRFGLLYGLATNRRAVVRQWFGRVSEKRSRAVESVVFSKCREVRVSSAIEIERYQRLPGATSKLVHFPWVLSPTPRRGKSEEQPTYDLGFIGSEDVMNIDALFVVKDELLPRLKRLDATPNILIAGAVCKAAGKLFARDPCVTVMGTIDSASDFYRKIRASIVPLRYGTGISVKLLEALSTGCRVISSQVGARGIDAEPSRLIVCDNWDTFAFQAANVVQHKAFSVRQL